MKKTIMLAALLLGVIACAIGVGNTQYRTSLGRKAPNIFLPSDTGMVSLDDLRGHHVLLNFWKSTDAQSRRAANEYTAWLRKHPGEVELLSVNLDESEPLFREIVRIDSLIPSTQHHVSGNHGKAVSDSYQLDYGIGSLLIDPNGKIVAHNPDSETLTELTQTNIGR